MWKYDVTVVVAVYNNEQYVDECVQSLIHQEYDFNKIQVILIDDGSTDNSANICEEYAKQYENIALIKHKNHGVSYTRNVGIRKAEGKYIMILDSDDFLSSNSIRELFNFMERNPEVDISSYTMKNYKEGKITEHYRNSMYFLGTGIYDIDEFPYFSQATINIIFRNLKENNNFYDEEMTLAEDEKFNTKIIMQKFRIGFCKDAIYYYRRHGASVSSTSQNPYYCFNQFMSYFDYLINTYTKDGKLPKYVQGLILQMVKWRISSDIFLPYHLGNKEYEEAINHIKEVLLHIDIDTILGKPNMDVFRKIYLLKLRGAKFDFKSGYGPNYAITCNDKIVYNDSKIELAFNRFKVTNNHIYMLGYVKSPICEVFEPELYIKVNGEEKERLVLSDSNMDYYGTDIKANKFYRFEKEISLDGLRNIYFSIKVNDNYVPLELSFSDWCAFNTKLERYRILAKNEELIMECEADGALIKVKNATPEERRDVKKELKNLYNSQNPMINFYRKFTKTNKKIWLYCDRKGVIDNAYYQFKNDIKKNDGIKRYYVIDGDKKQYRKYFTRSELRKHTIQKNSYRHKIMFLRSAKVITSFSSINEYSPFKKKTISWYKDILKYDLIYLQHGVLFANLIRMYSKEFTEIDKIVISSNFEESNMTNNYGYNEIDLIKSGMPRFDMENPKPNRKNKILFAPSWRAYLIGDPPVNGKRMLKKDIFLKSKFYNDINAILNNEKLDNLLASKGIELDFKLHPIFLPYKDLFKTNAKNIKVVDNSVKNEEYNLFVTDFSSFQFDFALLKTPMIYFVPDAIEFKAGLHTYRKLDLPLEDAFGDVIYTANELIDKIEYYIKHDFKPEDKYQERMEKFFYKTENCRDKIYDEILYLG